MSAELIVDCKKLKMYQKRFHPDTTFKDLTFDEKESVFPELADMGAVSRAVLESSKEFKQLRNMKLSKMLEEFCDNHEGNNL